MAKTREDLEKSREIRRRVIKTYGGVPTSVWKINYSKNKLVWDPRPRQSDVAWKDKSGDKELQKAWGLCNKSVRHGAQSTLPYDMIERVLKFYSNKGDTFLDPTMGDPTVMTASFQLGRNFIGYDVSEENFNINEQLRKKITGKTSQKILKSGKEPTIDIYKKSSENMDDVSNESVDVVFFSPPYYCLIPTTKIVCKDEIKEIKDIKKGDKVYTHKSNYKTVKGVSYRNIREKILKIKVKNNMIPLYLTKNHKIYGCKGVFNPYYKSKKTLLKPNSSYERSQVKRGGWKPNFSDLYKLIKPQFIIPTEFKKQDWLCYPINRKEIDIDPIDMKKYINFKKRFKVFTPYISNGKIYISPNQYGKTNIPEFVNPQPDFLRLLGYYIAEGDSVENGISFTFNNDEKNYMKDVKILMKKYFGLNCTKSYTYEGNYSTSLRFYSTPVSSFLKEYCGKLAHNKKIHSSFFLAPLKYQKELLKGLFRGDGCSYSEGYNYASVSPTLIEQIKQILFRFNIVPSCGYVKGGEREIIGKRCVVKDSFPLNIINKEGINRLSDILDVNHPKQFKGRNCSSSSFIKDDYVFYEISKIEDIKYKGEVYNLEVKDDNSYTTNVCSVHNCIEFYGKEDGQLGYNKTYEEFLEGLGKIIKECYRIMKYDTYCAININDFVMNGKFYDFHMDVKKLMGDANFRRHDTIIIQWQNCIGQAFASQVEAWRKTAKIHEYILVGKKVRDKDEYSRKTLDIGHLDE